jgi:D-alanyl-D-alanine dipeptidase
LQYRDAASILERLTDKSKRVLSRGMKVPYFEYKGLVEIKRLDPTILIDFKYATTENFTGKKHYSTPLCLMEVDAAKALVKASNSFRKDGYFIKIWDAYRPEKVQWSLYYATPSNFKKYVPPPSKFSQHSKGIAADITLVDKYQEDIPMPTGFDNFTVKAHIDYNNLPKDIIDNRGYLISEMKKAGFSVNKLEWWHYYFPDKSNLNISNVTFDEFIEQRSKYYLQVIKEN